MPVVGSEPPVPKIPRKWKRDRIEPTHWIYNGDVRREKDGRRSFKVDIPRFNCGWRLVRLEREDRKTVSIIDCGTGTHARVAMDVWRDLVSKGQTLNGQE